MKVLYVGQFNFPDKNPACIRVFSIAKILQKIGIEVEFLAFSNNTKDYSVDKIYDTFSCDYIALNGSIDKIRFYINGKQVVNKLKKGKYDAVIIYNYPALASYTILKYCKKNNIKVLADLTEWYNPTGNIIAKAIKTFDVNVRMNKINRHVDGIIAVSRYLAEYYKDFVETIVVPTFIYKENTCEFVNPSDCVSIMFAGNVEKNFNKERLDVVVNAFKQRERNMVLKICGVDKTVLEEKCGALPQNVMVYGRVSHDECIKILANSDFSIIPRETKINTIAGFPTKLSESFSVGVAVIATNVGDVCEYIVNGKNGYVLKECNEKSFSDLFGELETLNIEQRVALKRNVIELNRLTLDNFTQEMQDFFNNVLNRVV